MSRPLEARFKVEQATRDIMSVADQKVTLSAKHAGVMSCYAFIWLLAISSSGTLHHTGSVAKNQGEPQAKTLVLDILKAMQHLQEEVYVFRYNALWP